MSEPALSIKPSYVEAILSVLGYREDGGWVALALEMDLRGYGESWQEALGDLKDVVLAQIGFAHSKGQVEMIWRRAEERFWEQYREAQRETLLRALEEEAPRADVSVHAGVLEIPQTEVIEALRARFQPTGA